MNCDGMTIKELSEILLVSRSSIERSIRKFFPNIMQHGKKTILNEKVVTLIKKDLESHHNHNINLLNKSDLNSMKKFLNYNNEVNI